MGSVCQAQTPTIGLAPGVKPLPDSAASHRLLASLNALLYRPGPAPSVLPAESLATTALLEEVRGAEHSAAPNDPGAYPAYLTNVVRLDSLHYLLQLANVGVTGATARLRASYELIAQREGTEFLFYAPLRRNTAAWHSKTLGGYVFYYQTGLPKRAAALVKAATFFDHKLQAPSQQTTVYCCRDLTEALRLIGVTYKLDYVGLTHGTLSARAPQRLLLLAQEKEVTNFDPHDLWHQRLRNVLPANVINKPVDEGCAYLYGGSWGITWPQILGLFQQKVSAGPPPDWLAAYENPVNFNDSQQRPLLTAYVINALIVQKLERDKGFTAVQQLLSCGKAEKGNANYFKALEDATGITKSNFNAAVGALIRNSGHQ